MPFSEVRSLFLAKKGGVPALKQAVSCLSQYQKVSISMVVDSNEILLVKVYGEFRTGKTQMAHTMCVVAQLPPELGGASGKVGRLCLKRHPSPTVNSTR